MAVFKSYSAFRDTTINCHHCEWTGQGAEAKVVGETFGKDEVGLTEYLCPQCDGYLAIAPRPTIDESLVTSAAKPNR
jgi:hypothetical protein